MAGRSKSPDAAELARLLLALEGDEARPLGERARRDRSLRAALPRKADGVERLRAWLERVDTGGGQVAARAEEALRTVTSALVLLGGGAGLAGTLGVFYYDGGDRVNVLATLGGLVAVPLLLLVVSWAVALGGPRADTLPLLGGLFGALGRAAPGRLAERFVRWRPAAGGGALAVLLGHRHHDEVGVAAVRRWLIVRWSHLAGVAFFTGALATALTLVVFTDLAFGWSTTLALPATTLHGMVEWIATPWAWALPEAVPSLEVVAATLYFRLEGGAVTNVDPLLLGRWWSFLVMSISVYGLVPRGLSALVAGGCLGRAVARAFVGHPQARTLLERLAPAPVETGAADPPERMDPEAAPPPMSRWPRLDTRGPLFNWSRVPVDDAGLARALGGTSVHHAGGTQTIAAERDLVARLAGSSREGVAVVCKAWEPPVLELDDFLQALRSAGLGPVRVVPVRVVAGAPAAATAGDVRVWQRAFAVSEAELASLPGNHG